MSTREISVLATSAFPLQLDPLESSRFSAREYDSSPDSDRSGRFRSVGDGVIELGVSRLVTFLLIEEIKIKKTPGFSAYLVYVKAFLSRAFEIKK